MVSNVLGHWFSFMYLESPGGIIKTDSWIPPPVFLIQLIWGGAQEPEFLTSSKWCWYCRPGDHMLGHAFSSAHQWLALLTGHYEEKRSTRMEHPALLYKPSSAITAPITLNSLPATLLQEASIPLVLCRWIKIRLTCLWRPWEQEHPENTFIWIMSLTDHTKRLRHTHDLLIL